MEATTVPTLEEAKQYIYSIDFSAIIFKMTTREGWLKNDALLACRWYRNFLFLNKKYGFEPMMPPSEDIDEVWHHHILDTQNYAKDCNAIYGKFMHHYPGFGIDGKTDMNDLNSAFHKMQKLHFEEFGEYLYEIRGSLKKSGFIMSIISRLNRAKYGCSKKESLLTQHAN
ncbi:MAG: hypothetical protein Tsb005_14340 [Gammaproteobacteria bacterium]